MDREILFRSKRLDNGEWVEGCYAKAITGQAYILPESSYISFEYQTIAIGGFVEVTPSTVGQYTGLTDKNGVKIFEGDIVKWGHVPGYRENPVRIAEVKIAPDIQFDTIIEEKQRVFHYGSFLYAERTDKALEVIGNIHDNPELMGGEDDG